MLAKSVRIRLPSPVFSCVPRRFSTTLLAAGDYTNWASCRRFPRSGRPGEECKIDRVAHSKGTNPQTSLVRRYGSPIFAVFGAGAAAVTFLVAPHDATGAAAQDWSPFVLVSGLLLVGLVANDDGLFELLGQRLARVSANGFVLFAGAAAVIGLVTALLNLDTSVAFLTPVLVYAARSRGGGEAPLLYGSLLLANAGSLFLPGSNLTNLIVLGHFHLTGGAFLARMWAPALAALVATALSIAWLERGALGLAPSESDAPKRPTWGVGVLATSFATLLVVVLPEPALAVAGVGVAAVGVRIAAKKIGVRRAVDVLGVPILVGLFGVAVSLGAVGRAWSGPARLLAHLNIWETAVVSALSSLLVNNLPAASLLGSRTPPHPFALLVGLNLGPNLFVTGSLAWLLWLRAARTADSEPSLKRASQLGGVAVPMSMALALGLLVATGHS